MVIDIAGERRKVCVPTVRSHLIQPKPHALALFGRRGNRRVAQAVTPDVQPDCLPQFADDSQHISCFKSPIPMFPFVAERLEERTILLKKSYWSIFYKNCGDLCEQKWERYSKNISNRYNTFVATGRGRPKKYGRPAHAVTVTLPEDILGRLSAINADIGTAIVHVIERKGRSRVAPVASAEISQYGKHAVIVVTPVKALRRLKGVQLVPDRGGTALDLS